MPSDRQPSPPPSPLAWPLDPPPGGLAPARLDVPGSNLVLDLHGSPQDPQLVLFMAGNQFRVLPDLLRAFRARPAGTAIERVFYATLPPGRLLDAMDAGALACGNLLLRLAPDTLWPDAFMAGPRELQRLRTAGHVGAAAHFASNRGCVLLVQAGNPLGVRGVADLVRDDVRVVISSREREPASFASYQQTLEAQGGTGFTQVLLAKPGTLSPSYVHHREVPQCLADDRADAAPLFRHLAEHLVAVMPGRFEIVPLPAEGNAVDELWAAPVLAAPHASAASAWSDFLQSAQAAALLRAHGLVPAVG